MRVFEQCIHSKAPWVNAFAAWSEQPVQFMVRGDLKNMGRNLSHIIHMYRPFLMVVHLILTRYLAQVKEERLHCGFGGNPQIKYDDDDDDDDVDLIPWSSTIDTKNECWNITNLTQTTSFPQMFLFFPGRNDRDDEEKRAPTQATAMFSGGHPVCCLVPGQSTNNINP